MKTFGEHIWHSLTQEKEGKKNQEAWDRISFSFHVAMWVKEASWSAGKRRAGYMGSLSSFKGDIKMHMHFCEARWWGASS